MAGQGIKVDPYCRAASGIWAVGDVTGSGPYVHVAQYQARIAADDILGRPHPAHYLSVPRITFTDPLIAATGLTQAQAHERGIDIASITVDLSHAPMRPEAPMNHAESAALAAARKEGAGKLTLHADRERGTLIGAWAVAPDAGDWIQIALFAIRTETLLTTLHDMLEQFPSFSEVYLEAVEQLMG